MSLRTVVTSRGPVTISLDAPSLAADLDQLLVSARAVDELVGDSPEGSLVVELAGEAFAGPLGRSNARTVTAPGGLVGAAGRPRALFPNLAGQAYQVGVTVEAPGFGPQTVVQDLPPQGGYPEAFTPHHLGDVPLRRRPIVVEGQVNERLASGMTVPVVGALIDVTELWRRVPLAGSAGTPTASELVAISPGLYRERNAGTAVVRPVTLSPVAGSEKTLMAAAMAGDTQIRISDRVGLAVSDIVEFEGGPGADPDRAEYGVIANIHGAALAGSPATVELALPLERAHPAGAACRIATAAGAGPPRSLFLDGAQDDPCLLLAPSGSGFAAPVWIQVDDGGGVPEFHWLSPLRSTTDGDGFYRLPPITRIAQITVRAISGARSQSHTTSLAYPRSGQSADFLFT